jgi:hypothetical protein
MPSGRVCAPAGPGITALVVIAPLCGACLSRTDFGPWLDQPGERTTLDGTPPVTGAVIVSGVQLRSVDLSWPPATDAVTPQTALLYRAFLSTSSAFDTVAEVEAGTPVGPAQTGLTALRVSALSPATTYAFNVVVQDAAGNKASYAKAAATTLAQVQTPVISPAGNTYNSDQSVTISCGTTGATIRYTSDGSTPDAGSQVYTAPIPVAGDGTTVTINAYATYPGMVDSAVATETYAIYDNTPPTPGDSGVVSSSNVQTTGMTLTWTRATDDYTPQSSLQYCVYQSESNDIDTVLNAMANGTVLLDWTTDVANYTPLSLTLGATYHFNVLVKDARGNVAAYSMMSETTLRDMTSYYAFYKFSNNRNDSGPNGYNLSSCLSGPTITTNRDGTANTAYNFLGAFSFDYGLTYADPSKFDFSSEVTISYWINLNSESGDKKHICKMLIGTAGYCFGSVNAVPKMEFWSTGGAYMWAGAGALTAGSWEHVVVTAKAGTGGRVRQYLDGVLQDEVPWDDSGDIAGAPGKVLLIGAGSFDDPDMVLDGKLDDMRFYTFEATDDEVLYLYNLPAD